MVLVSMSSLSITHIAPKQEAKLYPTCLTSSLLVKFLLTFLCPPCFLLNFLRFSTLVEVLDNNTDKHVQHKETNKQEERDEVNQPPFIVVLYRLQKQIKRFVNLNNRIKKDTF